VTRLKLDYDDISFNDVELIFAHRGWLLRRLNLFSLRVARSRHGYHVEADVTQELDPREVILIQVLLGSDINREIYNLLHHLDGDLMETWNKLFDKRYIILNTRLKPNGGETASPGLTRRLNNLVAKQEAYDAKGGEEPEGRP
jgi:hypothetical protein